MEHSGKSHPMYNDTKVKSSQDEIEEGINSLETSLDVLYASYVDSDITTENISKKILFLKHLLEKDPKAADLKWSFFVAACNTYRCDTCLKPFPPMYIKNGCKDVEALRRAIEFIPPLSIILKELQEPDTYEKYGSIIELLYWVLIKLRNPYLKTVNKQSHGYVLRRVPSEMSVAAPNLIFQVTSAKQSAAEEKWKAAAQGHSTFYAYHGSRLENFHSIIHYGLQQNMCKRSRFGEGIYLSNELGVSLPFSPVGYGWGGSILGSELSCVALCELINHSDIKKGEDERNMVIGSMGGRIPNKYCLVKNSESVRVRYLLVYNQEFQPDRNHDSTGLLAWFRQHKFLTFVLGYVVLLASVGLTHNKQVEKYYRLFVQKAGFE